MREIDETRWHERHAELVAFVAEHGRFPSRRRGEAEGSLEDWVRYQRKRQRLGTMLADRRALLEGTPGWFWADSRNGQWERRYAELAAFVEQHGRHPRRRQRDELSLAQWADVQRTKYHGDALDAHRAQRLEELPGWRWRTFTRTPKGLDELWDGNFRAFAAFVAEHGRIPSRTRKSERPLEYWMSHQRRAYNRGGLSNEQLRRLDEVPGWRGRTTS